MKWPVRVGEWDRRIKLGLMGDDTGQRREHTSRGGGELVSREISVK